MSRRRALIYQPGALGDTVMSLPAIAAIRADLGRDWQLCLLHERAPGAVVPEEVLRHSGLVDCFISYPVSHGMAGKAIVAFKLWWRLRKGRFRRVYYLVGSKRPPASVWRDAAFFLICGIRERIGFHSVPRHLRCPRDPSGRAGRVPYEAYLRLERLRKDGVQVDPWLRCPLPKLHLPQAEYEAVCDWLLARRRYPDRQLIAVCPGTKMRAKRWPLENFVQIGRRLWCTGRYELVVVGGPADHAEGQLLIDAWGDGINACGALSVTGTACLLSLSRLCLTVDSGPMHLAVAVGTQCIAIFSGRDFPGRWDPPGDSHVVLRHPVECSGCMAVVCKIPGHPCMTKISSDEVWEALRRALGLQ